MQLKPRTAAIIILGLFWGIIGLSMVTGTWQTKATEEEIVVESSSDIKGWMTLADVSKYFELPVPELVKALELPADVETNQPLKEIAEENGKEVDDLREVLAAYLGVVTSDAEAGGEASEKSMQTKESGSSDTNSPVSTQIGSEVPVNSVDSGRTKATQTTGEKPPTSQVQSTEQQSGTAAAPAQTAQPAEAPKNPESGSGEEQVIKGKMTLGEVEFVTKVPASYICKQLGIPETVDKNKVLRDLGQEYRFEVDSVRDIVAKYKP